MRKPVLPRILGLIVLYCMVFIAIVMIQFAKRGNFTQRIGGMVVSGQYSISDDTDTAASEDEPAFTGKHISLAGGASVYFRGIEFNLRNRDSSDLFALIDSDDHRTAALAKYVRISDDAASFMLSDGTQIIFQIQSPGGIPELRITGKFADGISGLDIPAKPQRPSLSRETSDGNINITHDGSTFQFNRPVHLREKAVVALQEDSPSISYRAIPERKVFNPLDYLVSNAQSSHTYNSAISQWRDQKYSYWRSRISVNADEDSVIAFSSEAVRRGNLRDAVASVSRTFFDNPQRGHGSSVYIGGMTTALRSFLQSERDATNRITRLINEKSPELLIESHVFEFLYVRSHLNMAESAIEIVRSINQASLTYEMCPGIFEGYMDIRHFRIHGDNPFDRLTELACNLFSDGIRKDTERDQVFIFRGDSADIEYNLRLANVLIAWGTATGRDEWANLGRSLILSAISLQDNTGAVPAFVNISEAGMFSNAPGTMLSAAYISRFFNSGDYYPHAVVIGSGVNSLWAWTAASAVSATQESNILNIAVSFPMGETHHMMIRGIRPFTKIQMYNMDYPSDPQFERYDSSGWVYSAQEQILTVKMKHRGPVEYIRVFY